MNFAAIFEALPTAHLMLSTSLTILGANPAYLRLLGRSQEDLVGRNVFEVFPVRVVHAAQQLRTSFSKALEGTGDTVFPLNYPVRDAHTGAWVDSYWSVSNQPWFGPDGEVQGIVQWVQDVTDLAWRLDSRTTKRLDGHQQAPSLAEQALESTRIRGLMQQSPGFLAIGRGPQHIIEFANDSYYSLVGHRDLLEKPVREALPELEGQGFFELLDQVYSTGQPFIGRAVPIKLGVGSAQTDHYIDFVYQPVVDRHGCVSGIFVQGHDVTEAHNLTQQISHQATHDSLTGLFNRRWFENQLRELLRSMPIGSRSSNALIYFDLDRFKVINDTCGHAAGDELLRILSERIRNQVRESDALARLGGDEFGLLMRNCTPEEATSCAEQLRRAIESFEFVCDNRVFGCSASFGIALLNPELAEIERAIARADAACFLAKEKGRNRVQLHFDGDEDLVRHRRETDIVSRLRAALNEHRLELWAQIIEPASFAGHDKRDHHHEILVRLRETNGDLVPPMAFIPAAERYGMMPVIDRYVIEKTFQYLCDEGRGVAGRFSVNLSGQTLSDEALPDWLQGLLARQNVNPGDICFEITETAAVRNLTRTTESIRRIKSLGFSFALDDFGSGMSSLGYLRALPVDYLKIDGIFIRDVLSNEVDAAMVRAIAEIARLMGIRTVAEYVDSDATRAKLATLGVDFVQGYGIGMPAPLASAHSA